MWLCEATDCSTKNLPQCRMGVLHLLKMSKNDQLLPQTDITVLSFQRLLNKISGSIPNALKIINDGVRQYNQKLWHHEKRDLTQALFVSRNHLSRPSRSGYLQPKKTIPGNLLFYIEEFLYLVKGDKAVETKLRFFLATGCTVRYLNNIRSLAGTMKWNLANRIGSNKKLRAQFRRHWQYPNK